jgi:hypothetical protein
MSKELFLLQRIKTNINRNHVLKKIRAIIIATLRSINLSHISDFTVFRKIIL